MNKTVMIIIKLIPVIAAPLAIGLMVMPGDGSSIRWLINITTLLGFAGFAFFFVGKKFGKEEKIIKVLSYLDLAATGIIILFYTAAIFAFGL